MPIAVQLPGYRPGQAAGIADVLGVINQMRTGGAQRDQLAAQTANTEQETKGKELANQQSKIQADIAKQQMELLNPAASQETIQDPSGAQVPNPVFNPRAKAMDDMNHSALAAKIAEVSGVAPAGTFDSILNASKNLHGIDFIKAAPDLSSAVELQKSKYSGGASQTRAKVMENNSLQSANSQYTSNFSPSEDAILSANRATGIIKRIKSGELKSTPTLGNDLSNALAQMYARGGSTTVSGTEHARAGIESMGGHAAEKYGFTFGDAVNTIAPKQLDQLEKDLLATKDEMRAGRKNAFDSWVLGMPAEHQSPLKNRFNSFSGSALGGKKESHGQSAPAGPKEPPGGHASVTQGGHTFNWNASTGKYE